MSPCQWRFTRLAFAHQESPDFFSINAYGSAKVVRLALGAIFSGIVFETLEEAQVISSGTRRYTPENTLCISPRGSQRSRLGRPVGEAAPHKYQMAVADPDSGLGTHLDFV